MDSLPLDRAAQLAHDFVTTDPLLAQRREQSFQPEPTATQTLSEPGASLHLDADRLHVWRNRVCVDGQWFEQCSCGLVRTGDGIGDCPIEAIDADYRDAVDEARRRRTARVRLVRATNQAHRDRLQRLLGFRV